MIPNSSSADRANNRAATMSARICRTCGDPIRPGQRATKPGDEHTSCAALVDPERHAAGLALSAALVALMRPGAVLPEHRCMGRDCGRVAAYSVQVIDERKAAHEFPVRLCLPCLAALDETGRTVDIFQWLSNNRIEAEP